MTDYELIVLVIMIVTLAFSIHNGNPKGESTSRHPALADGGSTHSQRGEASSKASSLPAVIIAWTARHVKAAQGSVPARLLLFIQKY